MRRIAIPNRDLWAIRDRIAAASGMEPVPRVVSAKGCAAVAVWGRGSPRARRMAGDLPILRCEDGFMRAPVPGRGRGCISLVAEWRGLHNDPAAPGRLPGLIDRRISDPLADAEGEAVRRTLLSLRLSKYPGDGLGLRDCDDFDGAHLLADQRLGDASLGGRGEEIFHRMLIGAARRAPGPLLLRAHPAGAGHFSSRALRRAAEASRTFAAALRAGRVRRLSPHAPPAEILPRVAAVHVASSLMGLEALIHGRRVCSHAPSFYAARGLTVDLYARTALRPAPLCAVLAAAYLDHCLWFAPEGARPLSFFEAARCLRAELDRDAPPPARRPGRLAFLRAAGAGR